MTTIYLVRHGETDWNVEGRVQGHQDSQLTVKGEKQALALAKELKSIAFDAIYSSDLSRAKRTAEIMAAEHKLAVITTQALRERASGVLEGRLKSELTEELKESLERYERLSDSEQMADKSIVGMESWDEVLVRTLRHLREIAIAHDGQNVLMVTHGGVMRTLLAHLGYLPFSQLPAGVITNTGYIKLHSDGVDFFLEVVNGLKPGRAYLTGWQRAAS